MPQRPGLLWRDASVEIRHSYTLCDHADRWFEHAMRVLPQHVGIYIIHDRYGIVDDHA